MGIEGAFYKPRTTRLNLGLSCLIASEAFIQSSSSNESSRVPCTVSCVSRLIDLRRLRHPNIVRYLDAQCDKHRRIYLVTEYYASDFSQLNPPVTKRSDFKWLLKRFHECLNGLAYLESHGIVHGCLSPSSILIDNFGQVRIAGYGILYASRWGLDVDFPVVNLRYSSPETLLLSESCLEQDLESARPPCSLDSRSDLWSLALIFTELLHFPLQIFSPEILLRALFNALDSDRSFFAQITSSNRENLTQLSKWMSTLDDICVLCLVLDARLRPPLAEIASKFSENFNSFQMIDFDSTVMCGDADGKPDEEGKETKSIDDCEKALRFLQIRDDPAESYYYWQLAGGGVDLASTFLRGVNGNVCLRPPILRLPLYLTALSPSEHGSRCGPLELWSSGNQPARLKFCPTVVPLPADRLLKRLARMPTKSLYPLLFPHSYSCLDGDGKRKLSAIDSLALTGVEDCWQQQQNQSIPLLSHLPKHELSVADSNGTVIFQPVLVKQADVEYQVMRVCLFRRLLAGMPSTATRLLLEARFDIPPFLRTEVWAALLGVESGYQDDTSRRKVEAALSIAISASSSHSRIPPEGAGLSNQVMGQIGVDLPRCHAYDLLIGSPLGQERLRSVLVAALLANGDRFEYTQGMDSLAAVFTRLFFPAPEVATHCLSNLLTSPRLVGFFSRRRFTTGLQAYFVLLLRLLAFHVPAVAAHFARLGVPLTGLTAGWIYTLFAHSMPLDRVEILWDSLLAASPSLPMLVYVSIFHQVNQQCRLLSLNQESICTLLSNFPDFNLDQCLEDAANFAAATPISLTAQSIRRGTPGGWMDSLARSLRLLNQTHKEMHSTHTESDSLHQRGRYCVNCLSKLPTHVDVVVPDTTEQGIIGSTSGGNQPSSPSMSYKRNELDYRSITASLVPLIDPSDALQQLSRSDCILVDMRSKEEYSSGCLMQSIHYCPVEVQAGVTYLTGSQLWMEATAARNASNPRGCAPAHSPGLVMLLQHSAASDGANDECKPGSGDDVAFTLACGLIQRSIDRVCVVKGGAKALLNLPQITDYFVSPHI
ncbi:TBC domain-containing protein kinase-like protein [Taenia crassiceps]|uniref:non-specific serine/threonine protein kinase n=1 Tax=Taenia crassiceps TaxID=6207 RepID=A0ABR4Q9Y2_9CEST